MRDDKTKELTAHLDNNQRCMIYLNATFGDPFLFAEGQAAWGRTVSVAGAVERLSDLLTDPELMRRALHVCADFIFALMGVALVVGLFGRLRGSYLLYTAYTVAVPLATIQVVSMPRYLIVAFPLFIALAERLRKPAIFYLFLIVSGLLQLAFAVRWSLWYWVA